MNVLSSNSGFAQEVKRTSVFVKEGVEIIWGLRFCTVLLCKLRQTDMIKQEKVKKKKGKKDDDVH